eukprot:NP_508237.1 Uncharacterized protein CELE_C52B11.4 [Caenorhabditis elegans]
MSTPAQLLHTFSVSSKSLSADFGDVFSRQVDQKLNNRNLRFIWLNGRKGKERAANCHCCKTTQASPPNHAGNALKPRRDWHS